MSKGFQVARVTNHPLAVRLEEIIAGVVAEAEKESAWLTLRIEISLEAGKIRTLREVVDRTWKEGPNGAQRGEVLTEKAARP